MEKGRLKIFFGYSAGVGKTYSMLEQAGELKAQGVDVIIGYIERHARPDTMSLTEGMESLTLRQMEYHGIMVSEFDIDSAIARRPEIILVDELAHTNAEGSKHAKRYQDVLELLNNGISVYTTVNVQHLEGLNDIIGAATLVKVGETVPDEIFDMADEVELIDIEPNELLERLKAGKVYKGDTIATALENFFTIENLDSLREVAMRRCADRIVKQRTPSDIKPKILALISPSPSSQKNIRVAAQMASNSHCKFSAMYVERSGEIDDISARNLKQHIKLVGDLDGEIVIKYGDSVVDTIENYVKINGVTQIIIGKTWQSIGKKVGLEEQILAVLPDIEVLIVPDRQSQGIVKKRFSSKLLQEDKWLYIAFATLVSIAVGLLFVNKLASFVMATASLVAVFVALIYERRAKARLINHFKQSNRALDCANILTANNESLAIGEILKYIATILAQSLSRSVLLYAHGEVAVKQYGDEDISFFDKSSEQAILGWCIANNKPAGLGTDTLRSSEAIYLPIKISDSAIACVAIGCSKSKLTVTDKVFFSQIKNIIAVLLKNY